MMVPFADELEAAGVTVSDYRESWPDEAAELLETLWRLVPDAIAVEHIGSTSVPGLAAKPCLDVMIVVTDLPDSSAAETLSGAGYRPRPEAWNLSEPAGGRHWPKMVFAPPIGASRCNIHVRPNHAPTVRIARLFRDHLIANPDKIIIWSDFKRAAAAAAPDLAGYGRLKAPAWALLMECAEVWAERNGYDQTPE